jgi:hypothetical protein
MVAQSTSPNAVHSSKSVKAAVVLRVFTGPPGSGRQWARWELDRRLFRRGRKRRLVSVTGWNYHSEPVPRKLAAKLYRTNWDGCRRYFKEARANQTTCDWDDPRLHRRSTVPRKLLESAVSGLC